MPSGLWSSRLEWCCPIFAVLPTLWRNCSSRRTTRRFRAGAAAQRNRAVFEIPDILEKILESWNEILADCTYDLCRAVVSGRRPVPAWMDRIAQEQLSKREAAIARIQSVAAAEARRQMVRAKILELIGGLPDYAGPLNARVTGQHRAKALRD